MIEQGALASTVPPGAPWCVDRSALCTICFECGACCPLHQPATLAQAQDHGLASSPLSLGCVAPQHVLAESSLWAQENARLHLFVTPFGGSLNLSY